MAVRSSAESDLALAMAQTWGVGYGLKSASEWQEVFKTAAKTAVILVILDMLRVTKDVPWFEARQLHSIASDASRLRHRSTWTLCRCRPRC